jgi:hypothetical protein
MLNSLEEDNSFLELARLLNAYEELPLADKELLLHYEANVGQKAKAVYTVTNLPVYATKPVYIFEFEVVVLRILATMYATNIVEQKEMYLKHGLTPPALGSIVSFLTYTRQPDYALARFLAGLALYPSREQTVLALHHTMEFPDGLGITEGSALSAAVFSHPFLQKEFRNFQHFEPSGKSTVQVLWYLPLYPSERAFFKTHHSLLFIKLAEAGLDLANFYRQSLV